MADRKIVFDVELQANSKNLKNLQSELASLRSMTTSQYLDLNKGLNTKDAREELNKIRSNIFQVEQAFRKSFNADLGTSNISKLRQELSKVNINELSRQLSTMGVQGQNAFRDLTVQVLTTNKQFKESHALLEKMGTTLANSLKWTIASSAVQGMTGSVQRAYGFVKQLDESLTNIKIVTGQSNEQMQEFAKSANTAAQALGSTTTAYTDAALIYYQQGLSGEEVLERTNTTIKMANALGESSAQVSDYMTAIWNNFAKGSENLEYFADVITALGASTAASSQEIAEGLEKFASVAEASGLSYEYATSALATVVAKTRQSADSVGTSFKTIFARIQGLNLGETLEDGTTLNKYSKALQAVGISIKDQNGELKKMDDILDEMGTRWKTLNEDQKLALAQTVAGTRQYNQLVALMENWDDVLVNVNTASNSMGTLETQQAAYAQSLEGHLKNLKTAQQEFYMAMFDTDSFKDVIDVVTQLQKGFTKLIEGIGGGGNALIGLGSIALNVFGNQIANSLGITIRNFRANAAAIKENTDRMAILQALGKDSYVEIDPLLKVQGELSKYTSIMTDSQKEFANAIIREVNENEKAKASWNDKAEAAAKFYNSISKNENIEEDLFNVERINFDEDPSYDADEYLTFFEELNKKSGEVVERTKKLKNSLLELQSKLNTSGRGQSSVTKEISKEIALQNTQIEQFKENYNIEKEGLDKLTKAREALNESLNPKDGKKDYSKIAENLKEYNKIVFEIFSNIESKSQDTADTMKNALKGASEDIVKDTQKTQEKINAFKESLKEAFTIKGITSAMSTISSGIFMINSAFATFQQFSEGDYSAGIAGLSSTVLMALPKIAELTKSFEEAAKAGKLMSMGIGTAVAGIALIAYGVYKYVEQSRKSAIEAKKALVEQRNQRLKEIEENQALEKSYEDLNEQFKKGEITRNQLADGVEELCDKYGIENGRVLALTGRYQELEEAIRSAADAQLQEQNRLLEQNNNDLVFTTDLGISKEKGVKLSDGSVIRPQGNTSADLVQYYEQLQRARSLANEQQRYNDVKKLSKEIEKYSEAYTQINGNLSQLAQNQGEIVSKEVFDVSSNDAFFKDYENKIEELQTKVQTATGFSIGTKEFDEAFNKAKAVLDKNLYADDSTSQSILNYQSVQTIKTRFEEEGNDKGAEEVEKYLKNKVYTSTKGVAVAAYLDFSGNESTIEEFEQVYRNAEIEYSDFVRENRLRLLEEVGTAIFKNEDIEKTALNELKEQYEELYNIESLGKVEQLRLIKEITDAELEQSKARQNYAIEQNESTIEDLKKRRQELIDNPIQEVDKTPLILARGKMESAEFDLEMFKGQMDPNNDQDRLKLVVLQEELNKARTNYIALNSEMKSNIEAEEKRLEEINQLEEEIKEFEDKDIELKVNFDRTYTDSIIAAEEATDNFGDSVARAKELIDNNNVVTAENIEELLELFPELAYESELVVKNIDGVEKGYLKLSDETVKRVIGANEEIIASDKEVIRQKILDQKKELEVKIAQTKSELEIADKVASGEITIDQAMNEAKAKNLDTFSEFLDESSTNWVTEVVNSNEAMVVSTEEAAKEMVNSINAIGQAWANAYKAAETGTHEDTEIKESNLAGVRQIKEHSAEGAYSRGASMFQTERDEASELYGQKVKEFLESQLKSYEQQDADLTRALSDLYTDPENKGKGKSSSKNNMNDLEDKIDRYHDINIIIKQLTTSLSRLEKERSKLVGQALLDNLNKELSLLNAQNDAYAKKVEIAKGEVAELQATLAGKGVNFNEDGTISNYQALLQSRLDAVQGLIASYNELSDADQKANKEVIEKAKKDYETLKKEIDNYDKLITETIPGLMDQITGNLEKEITLQISKFKMAVEIRLDLTKAAEEWNAFTKKMLGDTKANIGSIQEAFANLGSYYTSDTRGQVQVNTKQTNSIMAELEKMQRGEHSDIYSAYDEATGTWVDDQAAAVNDLRESYSQLIADLTKVEDLIKQANDAYLASIDKVSDAYDQQNRAVDYYGKQIQHDLKMVQMLYGSKAYSEMDKYYKKQIENTAKNKDNLKEQSEYWQRMMDAARAASDDIAYETYKQNWMSSIEELNSAIETWADNLKSEYENVVHSLIEDMNQAVTSGMGLDYVGEEWELINMNADNYLDTVNAAFEIQNLKNKYIDSINNTTDTTIQKRLNSLMESQVNMLREKDKLTQYDVDRANMLYEIELKRIALEESQNNKSQMRLRRDSSGNYSYQFVANDDDVSKAQDELAKAQNSLYNFDKKAYQSNLGEIYSVWKEFQDKIQQAYIDYAEDEEGRETQIALLKTEYGEKLNFLTQQNAIIRGNFEEDAFEELSAIYGKNVDDFRAMSDAEKDIILKELVPQWNSGVDMMAKKIGKEGFEGVVEDVFNRLSDKAREYNEAQKEIGLTAQEVAAIIENEQGILEQDARNVLDASKLEAEAIREVKQEIDNLNNSYKDTKQAAIEAAEAAYKLWEAIKSAPTQDTTFNVSGPTGNTGASSNPFDFSGMISGVKNGLSSAGSKLGGGQTSDVKDNGDLSVGQFAKDAGTKIGKESEKAALRTKEEALYNKLAQLDRDIATAKPVIVHQRSEQNGGNIYGPNPELVEEREKVFEELKKVQAELRSFDTGGYTGEWGNGGRVAMLHEKELVLNQVDTKNILDVVSIVRELQSNLNLQSLIDAIPNLSTSSVNNNSESVSQNISIMAEFKDATTANEIQTALENIMNVAVQRVNTNKK